ncbi:MAG: hypothetical protein mread185_000134 [Mycoplasmataceae bacterium]|nr:MAG: hypothetical protein mread185_000134 [Mycoplasmataceae bacterium]
MRGYNVNIYFSEENYRKISHLISERKISAFVNQAVEKELAKSNEERKNEIKLACQRMKKNKNFQSELNDWDKVTEDGIK